MAPRRRRCAFCSEPLPKDARSNRKFCDADCRAGRAKQPAVELGPVATATELAITAAGTELTERDQGAVAALRHLANKIDTEHEIREAALKWAAQNDGAGKPPQIDNVSVPTYLKYCESLGLTPAGRSRLEAAKPQQPGGATGGSKLTLLSQGIPRPGA
ncbi:terminase small subunit [Nocardioides jensenii]|uniref:terminase small subunit n=1 Tax=Nocardioides jensenii TaxID=1843 RepID=UPI000830A081|nr:hypothetical protein [Nocardioides jensenii]